MSQVLASSRRRSMSKTKGLPWLRIFGWGSLAIAFLLGLVLQQPDYSRLLQQAFPKGQISLIDDAKGEQYRLQRGDQTSYLSLGKAQGYGGPMLLAIELDEQGRIITTRLLEHKETPGFINRFDEPNFYHQFDKRLLNQNFRLDIDIDGLSGATLSSLGLTNGIREAAHNAAGRFSLPQSWQEPEFDASLEELLAILLFSAALLNKKVPRKWQKRYNQALSIASVVLIGFWLNWSLSIALIGSVLLGYFPSPQQHLLWYIMLSGTLGSILFLGRNVYCSQLCPFRQFQRWLNRLSGLNLQLYPWIKQHLKLWMNSLLWMSLMLIFISRNPAIGSYEPFAMLFSLDGIGIQWYILPLSLYGAFVVKDFWCKLLCPLGRSLNYSVEMRAKTLQRIRKGKRIAIKEVFNDQPSTDSTKAHASTLGTNSPARS